MDVESALSFVIAKLGYVRLKEEQKDAILSFVSGKDVFVSLPTKFGKSLCYQCLPMLFYTLCGHKEPLYHCCYNSFGGNNGGTSITISK